MSWLGRLIGRKPEVAIPTLPKTDDLDAKYAAMAEEPDSATGGPLLAGRLKYLEQIARHGGD